MAAYGRPSLRDLFDEAPTPHIAHPPETHHLEFYIATDGSFRESGGGLGAVIQTRDGQRVARLSRPQDCPDNNVAEYRALHLGLDVLAARSPADARIGILLDHDDLAANVNAAVLAGPGTQSRPHHDISVPQPTGLHWRGIRNRLRDFADVRAARINSDRNPAHPLANTPDRYAHVNDEPARCVLPNVPDPEVQIPPPSRSNRGASD
ncbi:Reverse transcriptase-like [Halovenus aranensis]|uniref:Reverse transcriptase-like n=1 Tax=Halovenus aranensis TaxID=890420 RepID=A0A1G8VLH7_9EURY|nr:reverse transcriptase-like protein [Halovenus aranensis]SDJ66767.1 Reverse transcriptase-like [Halovenus aranensis]